MIGPNQKLGISCQMKLDNDNILPKTDLVVLPGVNDGGGRIALECFINKTL